MFERITLIVLVACAIIAAHLERDASFDAAEQAAIVADTDPLSETGQDDSQQDELLAEANTDAHPDSEIIDQILERFAARHTALPLRERIALAHTIVAEARLHDLEPDLVMAVIEVESAGYHLAESHVGALGLMQLLPSTAQELAGKHNIEWKGPDTLFDPTTNVRLGTAYLRELANRYDGNVNTALAAYNWGPGRIDRRIRRGDSMPKIYVEQIRRAADRYAAITVRS